MKLIYSSETPVCLEPVRIDSRADYIYVYAMETEAEWWHYGDMSDEELCEAFDFYDTSATPGGKYRVFSAEVIGPFIIFLMTEQYNV